MVMFNKPVRSSDVPMRAIDELKSINSWVCWKYVDRPGAPKPTKPPVNPHNGLGASHSNPLHWGSYKQAEMGERRYGLAGKGFVLSDQDDFTGIDLDNCRDPETEELEPWAEAAVALAETYWEISPSGRGLRAFVRGKIPSAIKCDPAGVEIYGSQRYMTVTENHVEGTPIDIRPAPQTLEMLLSRVEAMRPAAEAAAPSSAPHINTTPRASAGQSAGGSNFFRAVNDRALKLIGMWAPVLVPGGKFDTNGAYRVSSKVLGRKLQEDLSIHPDGIVDHGVADMGDANQGRRSPIDLVLEYKAATDNIEAAKWLCVLMNVTPESLGWNDAPQPDEEARRIGEKMAQAKVAEREAVEREAQDEQEQEPIIEHAADGAFEFPEELTHPGGLLEDMIDWIEGTSQNPSRAVATASAIAVLSTVCGRAYCGPTMSGTHLYIALLGKTGTGKDHAHEAAEKLLEAVEMSKCIGSGSFTSANALEAHVLAAPISTLMIDEVGNEVAKFNNPRASDHLKGMTKALISMWGKNTGVYKTMRYAQSDGKRIKEPRLSILGLSTEDLFWAAFQGSDVVSGFMNRFMLIKMSGEYQKKLRKPKIGFLAKTDVPESIVRRLTAIRGGGSDLVNFLANYMYAESTTFKTTMVEWSGEDAAEYYENYAESLRRMGFDRQDIAPYFGRTAEMGLRLATIRAIGNGMGGIDIDDMKWGCAIADLSAKSMVHGSMLHMSGSQFETWQNQVLRIVTKYPGCPRSRIASGIRGIKPTELNQAIESLIDGNMLVVKDEPARADGRGGPKKRAFYLGKNAP